jgi:hypothetical protein
VINIKKEKLKILVLALVMPILFMTGIVTGLLLKELPQNNSIVSTETDTSNQNGFEYLYDDVVLIANDTYYGSLYPGIISGTCALIYSGFVEETDNVSVYINDLFYSTGKNMKSITICTDPWFVYGGWFFGGWNTSSWDNGRYKVTIYASGIEVALTYIYIKN